MKPTVNFIERYKSSLSKISEPIRQIVNRHGGLSDNQLLDLILKPKDYGVDYPEAPLDSDVEQSSNDDEECYDLGVSAIQEGKVAYCVMAGSENISTGQPDALLRIPGLGMSLLTLKLFQAAGEGPVWIVVSPRFKNMIEDHVRSQVGFPQERIHFIEQYQSYRLTPDNQLSFIGGEPNVYPCGNGDLYPVLTHTRFLEKFQGIKYISIVSVDNVMGFLDPKSIGRHIRAGANVSCEIVEKSVEEVGGLLCNFKGQLQIIESFKIRGTNLDDLRWLSTNSYIFNANLNIAPLGREWNRVQRDVGGKIVIQHERYLEEITDAYDGKYFMVNREDRYFPIKNMNDLHASESLLSANKRLF